MARTRLNTCSGITLELGKVHVDVTNDATSISGTFQLEHQPFASVSERYRALDCIKRAGAFVKVLITPSSSAPKIDLVYSATRAYKTDYANGSCCDAGSIMRKGKCGE